MKNKKRKVATTLRDTQRVRMRRFRNQSIILTPIVLYLCWGLTAMSFTIKDLENNGMWKMLLRGLLHPLEPRGEKAVPVFFLLSVFWIVFLLSQYVKKNNSFMHGHEHGIAEWGVIKEFNLKYCDKDDNNNRILSENVRFSYSPSTLRNGNMFVVGGSGAGKTTFVLQPNLLKNNGCNVYTDSKGTLAEEYSTYLEAQNDTNVYTIDMCNPEKSMRINPFMYIRNIFDLQKLITNFIQNTDNEGTQKAASVSPDPFWPRAEKLFFKSIFLYVWLECPKQERDEVTGTWYTLEKDWSSVLKLLAEAHFHPDPNIPPVLDERMYSLPSSHPARKTYEKYRGGADDTIRSIVLTADARMEPFDTPEVLNVFCGNDVRLQDFGVGYNGDKKTKSTLFIIIPDDDDTFSFVPGIVYTLLFQQLNFQARFYKGGRLPIPVHFFFDEFANIKMPNNFEKWMATIRSRGIDATIFLQGLSQMKTIFVEHAEEGVIGNCDTFLYLGGNEKSTYEYISKLLGEWTMDKQTTGESRGTTGSASTNADVIGRKLMDDYELRLLPNDECIIFVRGEKPLRDKKWLPWEHKEIGEAKKVMEEYEKRKREEGDFENQDDNFYQILNETEFSYFQKQQEKDKKIQIHKMDPLDFMFADIESLESRAAESLVKHFDVDKIQELYREEKEKQATLEREQFISNYNDMLLVDIYVSSYLSQFRKKIIRELNQYHVKEDDIKHIIHPSHTEDVVMELKDAYLEMYGKAST